MKTRTHTVAKAVANTAVIAPPPPAIRGLIRGIFLAGLTALALIAAPPAEAQTIGITATPDRSSAPGVQIDEGDTVTLTLTANGLTSGRFSVRVRVRADSASVTAADFTGFTLEGTPVRTPGGEPIFTSALPAETGTLSTEFRPSALTRSVTVTAAASDGAEPAESFVVETYNHTDSGANPQFTTTASITITIRANEGHPDAADRDFAISVDESTRTEGQTAVFTVALTGEAPVAGTPATVDWAVSGTGITAADYEISGDGSGSDGTLSFTALGSQTLTVRLLEDLAAESMETLTITLSNTAGGGGNGNRITTASADVTIAANTLARRLTLTGPATVAEGAEARYTVSLEGTAFANPTAITWTVMHGGTAGTANTDNDDLAATTGSIMFPTMTTFSIGIVDDDATAPDEPAETFTVTITAPDTASEVAGSGVTTTIAAEAGGEAETHELLLPEVTRAVVGEMFGAIAERVGGVGGQIDGGGHGGAGFSLNGQSNWSDIVASQARALAAGDGNGVGDGALSRHPRSLLSGGDIDAKQLLRGLRFASPVSAGAAHGHGHAANLAFWGGGDYRDFGGEDGDDDWDGTVFSLRFGVDGAVRENLRAGLMLSYSDAETEYTRVDSGNTTKGDYESELTAVSPYLRWQLGAGHAWASVSYGSGEVEVKPAGDEASTNDISMTGAAFGGGRKLLAQDGRELSLRADAFVAESEVEGDGDANTTGIDDDLDVDANRVRVALAWSYPGRFAAGLLSPAFDLGLRHDGGDGRTGGGLELGGALRYRSADAGITAEVNARALLGHSGDHRGWGIGGLMRVQNGADGQGLAVSVAPNYGGMAGDGDSQLWGRGLAAAGRSIAKPAARLDAEVGYGVPMTVSGDSGLGRMFGFDAGDGMLTPYSALRFGDSARDYRLGMKWRAARIDLDVFARHAGGAADDNSVAIEGRLKF